jgi:hypothetical protein
MTKKILLALASLLLTLFLFECVARFFVEPSDECYGVFLGRKLPPITIKIGHPSEDMKSLHEGLAVSGRKITQNDLVGVYREDPLLGSAPLENAVSVNGWWQSNALGALRRSEVAKARPPRVRRILTFGESFTQCPGVRLEDSWPFRLENINKDLEVINFGVCGYSMCQAYLRYKMLADKLDHDIVFLMVLPSVDPVRDVNVFRSFLGWPVRSSFVPRFEIEEGRLKLIPSPYGTVEDFYKDNAQNLSEKFKEYVRAHDRFYFRSKYESIPVIGHSILYKLFAKVSYRWGSYRLREPDSEAFQVVKKISEEMNRDVQRSGSEFILLFLPTQEDVETYKKSRRYREKWERLVSALVGKDIKYIDLMQGFKSVPENQIDKGNDGIHYGSRANRLIAKLITQEMGRFQPKEAR